MLDGVQPHAVQVKFAGDPYAPFFHLLHHFRVVEVQIGEHEVVVISIFVIHAAAPVLPVPHDLEHGGFARLVVVIRAGKVVPVPFEVGILVSAAGEIKSGPAFNFVGVRGFLLPVVLVHFLGHELFRVIGPGLVVHHGVQVNVHMVVVEGLDGVLELLLGAVLGAHGVFLVEFPQIKQVVGAVSHVVLFLALVGRRNPDGRHPYFLQMGGVFLQFVPELSVVGQVPLKVLHHDSVFHRLCEFGQNNFSAFVFFRRGGAEAVARTP